MKSLNVLRKPRNALVPLLAATLAISACSSINKKADDPVSYAKAQIEQDYPCLSGSELDPQNTVSTQLTFDTLDNPYPMPSPLAVVSIKLQRFDGKDGYAEFTGFAVPGLSPNRPAPADAETYTELQHLGCNPPQVEAVPSSPTYLNRCGTETFHITIDGKPMDAQICAKVSGNDS